MCLHGFGWKTKIDVFGHPMRADKAAVTTNQSFWQRMGIASVEMHKQGGEGFLENAQTGGRFLEMHKIEAVHYLSSPLLCIALLGGDWARISGVKRPHCGREELAVSEGSRLKLEVRLSA